LCWISRSSMVLALDGEGQQSVDGAPVEVASLLECQAGGDAALAFVVLVFLLIGAAALPVDGPHGCTGSCADVWWWSALAVDESEVFVARKVAKGGGAEDFAHCPDTGLDLGEGNAGSTAGTGTGVFLLDFGNCLW